ncbi:PAS domain-containing protein [Chondromyces crocatus]|uniref:Photoactive yellow protein n=1 Tax=Chondromyces crocatus TaxID=52 RepID=A0A0K1E9D4_CHOCO|nr:PAS domain-containing protein [Chondromyces crocatus]AKT37287.1 uncharacterized protein CMC5_014180 [Chondromyces crocatus]
MRMALDASWPDDRADVLRPRSFEFDIRVTDLDENGLDAQPFGIIRLDREGTILSYNLYEEKEARRKRQDVVGRNFFTEVAPCTKVKAFHGRFRDGVKRRELEATFGFVFCLRHVTRNVDVSLFYKRAESEDKDSIWVFIRG